MNFFPVKGNFLTLIDSSGLWGLTGVKVLKIRLQTADLWLFEKSKILQYLATKRIFWDFCYKNEIVFPKSAVFLIISIIWIFEVSQALKFEIHPQTADFWLFEEPEKS